MDGNFTKYEVQPEEVKRLLSETKYAGTVLLMNHRNDYANVAKAYGRYTVEWRSYPRIRQEPKRFSHWRAGYHSDPAVSAAGRTVQRKFLPAGIADIRKTPDGLWHGVKTSARDYELLTPGDAAFILQAFLRGANRPMQFRWISITRRLRSR